MYRTFVLHSLMFILALVTGTAWSTPSAAATFVGPARDCFAGPFESHDKWMGMLKEKFKGNSDTKALAMLGSPEDRFPKALFESRKAELDCKVFLYEVSGIHVTGYLLKPKNVNGKLPVILYNRGGNGTFGSLLFSGEIWLRLMPLAESGFLVLASQYRGGAPLAPQWKTANDEFGGSDVDDVVALLKLAEQIPEADLERVGVAGHSRGSMMSFLVAKQEPRIKALATLAGVADLQRHLSHRPEMENVYRARIPNYANEKEAALRARSPIHWLDQLRADLPILIIHGEKDERAHFENAQWMAKKLDELKRPYRLVSYPDGDHRLEKDSAAVIKELAAWFHQHLSNDKLSAVDQP